LKAPRKIRSASGELAASASAFWRVSTFVPPQPTFGTTQ
jgi:hypothetical protein